MSNELTKENVWEYPRPAVCEPFHGTLRVHLPNEKLLAMTQSAYRVLETSHPPSYYFPRAHVLVPVVGKGEPAATGSHAVYLRENSHRSFCEWKGTACYFDLITGDEVVANIAWSYQDPQPGFAYIRNYFSFYASRAGTCWVNDQRVAAQEGDFYGGWITANLTGPFKGAPGTGNW